MHARAVLSRILMLALPLAPVAGTQCVSAADRPESGAGPAVSLPPVEVSALRNPVEKSYRKIVRGMDLFERRHSLAPDAALRFKLLPRNRNANMQDISLAIVGDRVSIPVPVAADNTFALQRSEQALREDALVTPNRKARSMTWRTDIRTPGLPPNTRRLGDLRIECLVGEEAGLISNVRGFFDEIVRSIRSTRYCGEREPHYLFFADRPLWSVTLVYGQRREVLSVDSLYAGISRDPMTKTELQYCDCEVLLDRTYYAPLGDRSWPDDTLLYLDYMDSNDAAEIPAAARKSSP